MTYGSKPGGYSGLHKWLHWLVALSVLTTVPVAFAMGGATPGPMQDNLYNFHKSLGVLILVLMIARLASRVVYGAPAPEPTLSRLQRAASSAVHGLLYVLLIAMPIGGYLANSAFGASTPVFGLFEIPPAIAKNDALADQFFTMHRRVGFVIIALAAVHAAAALHHYFIRKDGVLQRMLPRALGGV